jgi:hypothetical protein
MGSETQRLLHVFDIGKRKDGRGITLRKMPVPRDVVAGWDEMQGYENVYGAGVPGYDTVGLSWGDVGHGLNLALNPVAQYHALQRAWGGGGARPAAPPRMPQAPQLPPTAVQALQGGPRRLLSYMGLGSLTWASTDTLLEKQMIAEPQAAFRGRRLVISQAKTSGASGIAATITKPLTVSGMPQTPAPDQAAPVEMFDASTTYSMLDLQIATSATQISISISVSAIPSSGNTVIVTAGLYGEWLR